MGCRYVADGEQKFSKYWPSNTSATDAYAMIADDSRTVFEVQADASVTAGDLSWFSKLCCNSWLWLYLYWYVWSWR